MPNHDCQHETQIQGQSRKITELEARADFKDQRIEQIIQDQRRMEDKIDTLTENVNQLMLKTITDDNNLNQRVTTLEASQDTMWRVFTGVSVLVVLATFILNYIHI